MERTLDHINVPLRGQGNRGKKNVIYYIKYKSHKLKVNMLIYHNYFNFKLINKYKRSTALTYVHIIFIIMPVINNNALALKKRGRPRKTLT